MQIKELMGYYKFTTKQRTQCTNHLEALKAKNSTSYAIKDLEKNRRDRRYNTSLSIYQIPKCKPARDNFIGRIGSNR